MRIAISAETSQGPQSRVAHHFGRCPFFALVEVEEKQIQSVSVIDNPFFAAHQPGQVPGFINDQSASVMISGGMGRRAIEFFTQFGIEPFTGASDTVEKTVQDFLDGKLQEASSCAESEAHGHSHDHDHHH